MPKPRRLDPAPEQPGSSSELRRILTRKKKSELVDVLMELAQADRGVLRQLTARFDVPATPDERVTETSQAIADATAFDKRDINHNFDYDYEAYDAVRRNLGRLIAAGELRLAMQLALDLMKRGSHQVEMSDEGLMAEDIATCLSVVIDAVSTCDLPAEEALTWCSDMLVADRVALHRPQAPRSPARSPPGGQGKVTRRVFHRRPAPSWSLRAPSGSDAPGPPDPKHLMA